jgi:hypothetical protein
MDTKDNCEHKCEKCIAEEERGGLEKPLRKEKARKEGLRHIENLKSHGLHESDSIERIKSVFKAVYEEEL